MKREDQIKDRRIRIITTLVESTDSHFNLMGLGFIGALDWVLEDKD